MKNLGRFFEILADEAIMGIVAFDSSTGECIYINRLASEILEATTEIDEEGRGYTPLLLPELFPDVVRAGSARPFAEEMLRHEGLSQDVLVRKKNGLFVIANVGIKHVKIGEEQDVYLIMFQDITVQKKLQREVQIKQEEINKAYVELLEQNRQLRELDLAKDKFIALTTHELRTPLAAIVGTAEILKLGFEESPEQKTELIHILHEQALHLMDLVNDVLDFAKIRAGKMDYYVEQLDLFPLVKRLAVGFDQMANQAQVTVEVAEPDEPIQVWADALRLKEIVNNVINNAIKYNRSGGRVFIRLEAKDEMAMVLIQDTGQGIPIDRVKHVFNEFETVGNVARHHKGTGLGMPISKRLVEGMGGGLWLESEVGVGTTFFIALPQERVLDESFYRSRPDSWGDLAA